MHEGNKGISGGGKERFEKYLLVCEKGKNIVSKHSEKAKAKQSTLGG